MMRIRHERPTDSRSAYAGISRQPPSATRHAHNYAVTKNIIISETEYMLHKSMAEVNKKSSYQEIQTNGIPS
jgi:hypothetical protein